MAKKRKPKSALGRSPLPRQTGGPHKTPKDYDRRKWRKLGEGESP